MTDATASMLQFAVGNATPIRLSVRSGAARPETVELATPFAMIGRARDCDICLPQENVAFRHVYLQVIGPRVACIDLFSAGGIGWDGPAFQGWLSPEHRFRIGESWLQLFDDGWIADPTLPSPLDFKPRNDQRMEYGVLPQVDLELLSTSASGTLWPINRVITLVGRDERCRISCGDDKISRVHCSLLLLPTGLWVVDLLGKSGVRINGDQVRCGLLAPDSEFEIGPYRLRPRYVSPAAAAPTPAVAPPVMENMPDAGKAEFLTRLNRLFRVEAYADTLILLPHGETPHMTYKEIHIESSRISELQTAHGFRNLLVDGSQALILNSMVLDAIIGFCRASRGRVTFCHLTPEVLASIQSMNLDRIWPVVATRHEALHQIYMP